MLGCLSYHMAYITILLVEVANIVQAEGIQVSPYSVRKALENTCAPIGCLPEDKLSNGEGLLQIDRLESGLHTELLRELFDYFYYIVWVFS